MQGHFRNAVAGFLLVVVLLLGGSAGAAEQGITGKKLLLKPGKLVLVSKDAGIGISGSDPIGGTDSSVSFHNGGSSWVFALPKTNWSSNGAATLLKYKNSSAPGGPSAVKIAKVKPGLLKLVAKQFPSAVPNGPATIEVVLSLDGGTNNYCMSFNGTGDGRRFLAKNVAAGSCVNACGDNMQEGAEACDGNDDLACPGECFADCTCPALCSASGGDSTACFSFILFPSCSGCCAADTACNAACTYAQDVSCSAADRNASCSQAVNDAGCNLECCNF